MIEKELFEMGQLVATPGALEALGNLNLDASDFVRRHLHGDWGKMCESDAELNVEAVEHGYQIQSSYAIEGATIWVITEGDRSVTTVLLPSDY